MLTIEFPTEIKSTQFEVTDPISETANCCEVGASYDVLKAAVQLQDSSKCHIEYLWQQHLQQKQRQTIWVCRVGGNDLGFFTQISTLCVT